MICLRCYKVCQDNLEHMVGDFTNTKAGFLCPKCWKKWENIYIKKEIASNRQDLYQKVYMDELKLFIGKKVFIFR